MIKVSNSSSVYLKFGSLEEIKSIMKQHLVAPFCIGKKKLNLCLVNKLPLDLNQKSRIVLVTIYNEKIKINVFTFYHLFKSYGEIKKIIIFKKKNYQIFIEFESAEKAHIFKDSLHNINYKNYFFIKIQFTQKKELVINQNSLFEYDFSCGLARPFVPPVGPASFEVARRLADSQTLSTAQPQISQFFAHKPKEAPVDFAALKQKTINELNKLEEQMDSGVYRPPRDETDSLYSIEQKENISK